MYGFGPYSSFPYAGLPGAAPSPPVVTGTFNAAWTKNSNNFIGNGIFSLLLILMLLLDGVV